ncbi:MAG: amidophosphoribosyltransferase [Dehalococcoidales bacterium]|nr:amidophosphoribosyltransferase [Dehalococcoidales bacterium]
MHEACGVFGVYAPGEDISRLTYFALFALQHRGQESAGIATTDGRRIDVFARMGIVSQVFNEEALSKLGGKIAIGHNRYATHGSNNIDNVQPIIVGKEPDIVAIAYNGNITNAEPIYHELTDKGYTFKTTTGTEVAANLILSCPEKDMADRIKYAVRRLQGAYSMVIMSRDTLYAVRDPLGVRPLSLGKIGNGNNKYVIASETCALNHIGAKVLREIEPGEIVAINENGIKSYKEASEKKALCIFEYIYFSRPDSIIKNRLLYKTRQAMGAGLAEEYPVDADIVIGVPDSATAAGFGYAARSGIPVAEGLIKNRYMGRTFITPDQRIRELGVKVKFNPLQEILEGKRVVMVDDSIVRGTTTPEVIKLLRKSGAREVHMRICAPPICYPCFLGVDMANRWELIAAQKSIPEIRDFIGADSLGYLSLEGLIKAIDLPKDEFCLACFTGNYPMPVQLTMEKIALEPTCPKKHILLK